MKDGTRYTKLTEMTRNSRTYGRAENIEEPSGEISDEDGSFVSSVDSDHESRCLKIFNSRDDTTTATPTVSRGKGWQDGSDRKGLEALRKGLEANKLQQEDTKRRIGDATQSFRTKEAQLTAMLDNQVAEGRRIMDAMERLQPPVQEGPKPPGPRALRFVEGNCFTTISSAVIVFNVLVLIYQVTHPETQETLKWLNFCFLSFYSVEVLLKIIVWQRLFLCGPCDLVSWNLLDVIIVLGGVLDLIILPLFSISGKVRFLSALRALRLLRLLKLLHNFLVADSSWAEGETFQIFIMSLIGLSSLLMGLECDWPGLTLFLESIYWEQVVLAIFVFEVAVRLKHSGLKYFCDRSDWAWNWLDFIVVLGGVLDQWMLPAITLTTSMVTGKPATYNSNMGQFMVLLRMARLLRVLRLVRLVRQVPQLFNLLSGIAQAMAGMIWVLILVIVVLYFFALLSVKLFRDGLAFEGDAPTDVRDIFSSVPDTIFVLFTVMDGHKSILDPLLEALPFTKVVFMLFVMISEWAMLSILTAVVSENMITVTEARKEEAESADRLEMENEKSDELNEIFASMDLNKDGSVNLIEFDAMLKDEVKRSALCQASNLSVVDLRLMFNILERKGFVRRREFIEACRYEGKAVSERSLMKLEKRLAQVEEKISTTVVLVEGAEHEICNGTYVESGVHNLKPFYKKMDKSGCIIYFDFFWKLNDAEDTTVWRYRMDAKDDYMGLHLHPARWISSEGSATDSPRVRWESHHLLDKRIEYLEGLVLETHRDVRLLTQRMLGARSP